MKNFKLMTLWAFCALLLCSCEAELGPVEVVNGHNEGSFSHGPVCDNKPIMKFSSLGDMQSTYRDLYHEFQATQDEANLREWEQVRNFYSLRAKDEDMDNGNIPYDPTFESWEYTSDIILETMLNEEGMVIIGEHLYIWSDGCVIHRIPFSGCSDYDSLLRFSQFVKTYNGSLGDDAEMDHYRNSRKITDINVCDDPRYDFETMSEMNIEVKNDNDKIVEKGASCGLESHITHRILAHDPVNRVISIELVANHVAPIGSNPNQSFFVSNSAQFTRVEIMPGSTYLDAIGTDWSIMDGSTYIYPGKKLVLEVDYSNYTTIVPFLIIDLKSNVYPMSSQSCHDTDTLSLLLDCPISISKKPLDASNGKWQFTLEGMQTTAGQYMLHWDFGDGSPVESVVGTNVVSHTFPIPCVAEDFTVSVTIEKANECKSTASTVVSSWDTCMRQKATNYHKEKVDGKMLKVKIKTRKRVGIFGGGSKVVHRFRYRKNGTKTIKPFGNISVQSGSFCEPVDIHSLMGEVSQSGKKRLKQKYTSTSNYYVDLDNPYSVLFTHSNGYSRTLTYHTGCSK